MLTVIDFEGTSRLASSRATEIGMVTLSENFNVIKEYESLIKPPVSPDSFALRVSKLTNNELADAPTFKQAWPSIYKHFSNKILVAHNKQYEINVLKNEFTHLGESNFPPFLCTLEWSRKILGNKIPDHQLGTICEYLGIPLINPHEALSDAKATAQLAIVLLKKSPEMSAELTRLLKQRVNFEKPRMLETQPVIRKRIQIKDSDSVQFADALKRFRLLGFTTVVITGKPAQGKEGLGKVLAKVGLQYKETPPTKKTAFVVLSNSDSGVSKIRKAQELNVPILSESDTNKLIAILKEGKNA